MSSWWNEYKSGFASCLTICGVVAAVAIHLNDKLLDAKEAEIQQLQVKLESIEDASESYHKEQVFRKQAELRAASAETQLGTLEAKKWEEKFEAERIAKQSIQEKMAHIQGRYDDLASQIEKGTVDPSKDLEIQRLRGELEITRNELAKMTNLYTREKQKPPQIITVPVEASSSESDVFAMLIGVAGGMVSSDIRDTIVNTYKDSSRNITVSQLAEISQGMISGDILSVINEIGGNIRNDGDAKALQSLMDSMTSGDAKAAMRVIMGAKQ